MLDPFARDVAGDGRVVRALATNLVDLVDVDDASLGGRQVVVGRLQQAEENRLDVVADVARLFFFKVILKRFGLREKVSLFLFFSFRKRTWKSSVASKKKKKKKKKPA